MSDVHPSTELLLVRHGQARAEDGSYGAQTPLSELGALQAEAVASALVAERRPAAIYASPLPRASDTAAPLVARIGEGLRVDTRLEEFALPELTLREVEARPDLVLWRPEHRGIPEGETLRAFSLRVAAFCEDVVARHLGERVVAVAHSGTIDAALRWAVGLDPGSPWHHDFTLRTASITELRCWPRGRAPGGAPRYAAIGAIGRIDHLGELVG